MAELKVQEIETLRTTNQLVLREILSVQKAIAEKLDVEAPTPVMLTQPTLSTTATDEEKLEYVLNQQRINKENLDKLLKLMREDYDRLTAVLDKKRTFWSRFCCRA